MKTQYVIQTVTKKTGWGWETYRKTAKEAKSFYAKVKVDKAFLRVTLHKETIDETGLIVKSEVK